jgi:hypothetical protein
LKSNMNYKFLLDGDEMTAGFVKRIFHIMKQTLLEDNVRSAFMQRGLRCDIETSPRVLLFDANVLRRSPGFTSLWQRDDSREKLSQ